MPLKLEQGKERLLLTIKKNKRHRDYNHVVHLAQKYTAYFTGDNIESLLHQFVPRESPELFQQRVKLTSLTTPDIANTLATPMYKVGRTTADTKIIWNKKENSDKNKEELIVISSEFWGNASVDHYLTYRLPVLDCTDPNSFIVVEFDGAFDATKPESETNKKVKPYPFEVNSIEAIDYEYINNELQYLTVFDENLSRYTIYLENNSIVATQISKEDLAAFLLQNPNAEIWYKDEKNKENSDIYVINIYEHKAGVVPAKRVGTIRDQSTRGRTCVPMIHPAKSYFEKAIKTISEFDITNTLHTFPKVFRYGNRCPGDMKNGIVCNEGKNLQTGDDCPVCKGTGWSSQTTTASEVIVAAPKELKDMVSLDMMMAYKAPPPELLEFQKKLGLYELRECAIRAVYNSDTYITDTTAATATEKNIDLESVYDTLKPYADNWSNMWVHIMTLVAKFRDLGEGIVIKHSFPKDFKMKSLTMLLDDLKKANDSGAPSYVKQSINSDIAKKIYTDFPGELLRLQVKERFYPFNGKSENEINYILSNGIVSKFDTTLYSKFDNIFFEIEQEQGSDVDFYKMDYKRQKELITKKVQEYMSIVEEENTEERAVKFGSDTNYTIGDSVTIVAGKEQSPEDVGKTFTISQINGDSIVLSRTDGTTVVYSTDDIK